MDADEPARPARLRGARAHLLGAIGGLIAAAVGLAAAEVVAGLAADLRSPVLDVGDRFIVWVPSWLKDLAIEWFGTNDKIALLVGIGAVIAGYAAGIGIVALTRRRLGVALGGVAVFALVGSAAAVVDQTGTRPIAAAPSLVGSAIVAASLALLFRLSSPLGGTVDEDATDAGTDDAEGGDTEGGDTDGGDTDEGAPVVALARRSVLVAGGALGAAAVAFAATGRWLQERFSASESRAAVRLPRPVAAAPAAPAGAQAPAATPLFTPNEDFYRIDTALSVPQVPTEGWELRVTGMVDRELRLSYDELLDRRLVERDITLTCVSNTVGGDLIGNARWLGAPLDDLLDEAGVERRADQVVGRSVDGYTCGFPVAALDGRDALVAVAMNGEPLPLEHGFPARLIVAGLYGYVSATKWLTEIELTTFEQFDQYWVPRGYADRAPIKIQSRIDSPRGLDRIEPGPFVVGGVAWAQPVGIEAVELSIDDGEWTPVDLAAPLNDSTWRQWSLPWEATPGRHSLTVRAIDRDGAIQTDERSEPLPDGATGHHTVVVLVDEA